MAVEQAQGETVLLTPQPPGEPQYEYVYEYADEEGTPGPGTYKVMPNRFQKEAPSYSMRPKVVESKTIHTPGPGAYEQLHTLGTAGIKNTLHSKLHGPVLPDEPGPGAYDHHPNFGKPDDAYSFRKNLPQKPHGYDVPGPGAYSPRETLGDAQANMLKGRFKAAEPIKTPGPGQYETKYGMGKGQKKTFASRLEYYDHTVGKPGPGTHDVVEHSNYLKPQAASYTMRPKVPKTNTNNTKPGFPGPGTYEPLNRFGENRQHKTFSARLVSSKAIHTPGPGAYELGHPTGADGQKPTMHSKLHPSQRVDEPGPGAYDHHANFGRPDDAYSFRKRVGLKSDMQGYDVPGPGTYSPRDTLGEAQANAIKGRLKSYKKNINPGPGAYDTYGTDGGKKYPLGKGKSTAWNRYSGRVIKHANGVPGPGAYQGMIGPSRFFNKTTKPTYSFGTSQTPRFGKGPRRRRVVRQPGSQTERGTRRPKPPAGSQTAR